MRILYFAWIRERIGTSEEQLSLPRDVATAADLAQYLRTRSPGHLSGLGDLTRIRIAVNHVHVPSGHPVTDGDEVAFFSAGDRRMIRVQAEDFDVGAEIAALSQGRRDIGAVVSFVGLVRDFVLTLEHYPAMTLREIEAIVGEAQSRWPLSAVTVIHRHGRLAPGDRIVLVATASAHRQAAFEATSFLIDWLKTRAPFWKAEERSDGCHWVEANAADDAAAQRWKQFP